MSKTLSSFVAHVTPLIVLDGENDYKNVDKHAKEYFGGALPNKAVWKVIAALHKGQADFVDDLG